MGIGDLMLTAVFLFLIFDGQKWVAAKVIHASSSANPKHDH